MKTMLYVLLFGFAFSGCRPEAPAEKGHEISATTAHGGVTEEVPDQTGRFRLVGSQAGRVYVGMTVQELKASVPVDLLVEKEINREGQLYTVYEILNDSFTSETGMVAEPVCDPECRIYRIEVRDRKYQTPEGIGIGSTFGEVRQAFPIRTVSGEEGRVVAVSEEARLSFVLESSQFSPEQLNNPRQDRIPDSTLVTGILIL